MLESNQVTEVKQGYPEPRVTMDGKPYWEAVRQKQLMFQRCPACKGAIFPPRAICPMCDAGAKPAWEKSKGVGSIYSFSVVYRSPSPLWRSRTPYTLGLVQLDEDYFLFTEIEGDPQDMAIGKRVEVNFPDREVPLPTFRLV